MSGWVGGWVGRKLRPGLSPEEYMVAVRADGAKWKITDLTVADWRAAEAAAKATPEQPKRARSPSQEPEGSFEFGWDKEMQAAWRAPKEANKRRKRAAMKEFTKVVQSPAGVAARHVPTCHEGVFVALSPFPAAGAAPDDLVLAEWPDGVLWAVEGITVSQWAAMRRADAERQRGKNIIAEMSKGTVKYIAKWKNERDKRLAAIVRIDKIDGKSKEKQLVQTVSEKFASDDDCTLFITQLMEDAHKNIVWCVFVLCRKNGGRAKGISENTNPQ